MQAAVDGFTHAAPAIYHPIAMNGFSTALIVSLVLALCTAALINFIPSVIGAHRRIELWGFLLLVNLLVGWTLIGWLVCLIWALLGRRRPEAAHGATYPERMRIEPVLRHYRP